MLKEIEDVYYDLNITGRGAPHLDDMMKALNKLDARNVLVMRMMTKPGSAFIIFTEAPDKTLYIKPILTPLVEPKPKT